MLKIGSHVSMNKDDFLLGSVKEAISYNSTAFMFYTGSPTNSFRVPVKDLKVKEAYKLMEENNFDPNNVVIHAPYLINLGNLDEEKVAFSFSLLESEIDRTLKMGFKYIVLHPGASMKYDRNLSIKQVGLLLNQATIDYPDICILIETMAGKGSEIGITFDEVKSIIDLVENKNAIGVCLDTCHINDAGYNLNNTDQIIQEFDKIISLDYLKVIHINDSKNEIGAHKDRHENIGYGTIGFDNIINFIYHPLIKDKIFILETPYLKYDDKELPPYKFEIESIKNKKFNEHLKEEVYEYYK